MGLVDKVKDIEGYEDLYPHQKESIEAIEENNNVLLVAPTAAGKTLVAKAAILDALLRGKKAVYTSPLVALSSEKYSEFKEFFKRAKSLGIVDKMPKIAFVTGNITQMTGTDNVSDADILVTSFEKFDSLITRPRFESFIEEIGTIVIDEIHVLYDDNRGATVEKFATLIKHMNPSVKFVALSATVGNPDTIAQWFDAKPIMSNFRPVELKRFVYAHKDGALIDIDTGEQRAVSAKHKLPIIFIVELLVDDKQGIVFVSSRRSAEALARNLAELTEKFLSEEDRKEIESAISKIPDDPVSKKVVPFIKRGVSFHHSGLPPTTRKIVEDLFRKRRIKLLAATPGLSAGVNLPAAFVVVRDIFRYDGNRSKMLTAFEVQQMIGRAGRPQFEKTGIAIIVTDIQDNVPRVAKKYYLSGVEGITSPLLRNVEKSEDVLNTKIAHLVLQHAKITGTASDAKEFLKNTLAYIQSPEKIETIAQEVIDSLKQQGFLTEEGPSEKALATLEAYVSPATITHFEETLHENMTISEFIYAVMTSPECRESCNLRITPEVDIDEMFEFAEAMGLDPFAETDTIVRLMLTNDWLNGVDEEELYEKYGVMPGDLWAFLASLEWIAWAALKYADAKMLDLGIDYSMLDRIEYGIPEEALELISLPMIGRKRAKKLIEAGIKTIEDFLAADSAELAKILGLRPETVEKIKNSVL